MLFSDKLLFIHVPKTAGISITQFLIENTPGPFTITLPRGHTSPSSKVSLMDGTRHESLADAARLLAKIGRDLGDFDRIIATMRNPYDLEVSYYHYKKLGYKYDAGPAQRLALAGDFAEFARKAPYNGRLPARIEDWYQFNGKVPENLRIVRYESLRADIFDAISEFHPIKRDLRQENATKHGPYGNYLTPETERAIYEKYRWLFDQGYYSRDALWSTGREPVCLTEPANHADFGLRNFARILSSESSLDVVTIERILSIAFDLIGKRLRHGNHAEVQGLGTFVPISRKKAGPAVFRFTPPAHKDTPPERLR